MSVLCQLHLQAGTDAVLNVTFIRAPSNALLKVDVPLVFRGEDVSPGLRKGTKLLWWYPCGFQVVKFPSSLDILVFSQSVFIIIYFSQI